MATVKQKISMEMELQGADKAGADLKGLEGASKGASTGLGGIPPQALLVVGAVTAVAATVVASTKALIDNTKEMAEWGAGIYNNASAAQTTVEEYQALNYVLRQTTGQMDGAGTSLRAITTFLVAAETGTGRQAEALDKLNLNYDTLFAMSPAERYNVLTDAIGGLTDITEKQTVASVVFGSRYSTQVVAALDQAGGSLRGMMDTFRESNLIMDTESVDALKAYDDAITDFQMGMDILKGDLAVEFIPVMEKVLLAFQDVLPVLRDGISEYMPEVTAVFMDLVEKIPEILDRIEDFIWFLEELESVASLVPDPIIEINKSISDMASPLNQALWLWDHSIGKIKEADDAADELALANRRLGETQRELQITMVDMEKAITEGDIPALLRMRTELDNMEFGEHADEIDDINTALEGMTLATIMNSVATMDNALALATRANMVAPSLHLFDATIESLIAQKAEMEAMGLEIMVKSNIVTVTSGGTGGTSDEETEEEARQRRMAEKLREIEKEAKILRRVEEQQSEQEAVARLERIAEKELELITANKEYIMEKDQEREDALAEAAAVRQEAFLEFNELMASTIMESWDSGFDDIGESFEKLLEQMLKDLVKSGLLTLLSNLVAPGSGFVGSGTMNIFGNMLGGK